MDLALTGCPKGGPSSPDDWARTAVTELPSGSEYTFDDNARALVRLAVRPLTTSEAARRTLTRL